MSEKVAGIIPARFASTRLPGKPLLRIGSKPMIQWVYEHAAQATSLSELFVAADDERIVQAVEAFGGRAILTSGEFESGTDRVAWAAERTGAGIIINIQGDEPFLDPADIDMLAALLRDPLCPQMGTLAARIGDVSVLTSRATAKVVVDRDGNALYFSRSPIPCFRDLEKYEEWLTTGNVLQHIGMYGYRTSFLRTFSRTPATPLEQAEKLEQLRALEIGGKIRVAITATVPFGVDTPEDLERARRIAAEKETPSPAH